MHKKRAINIIVVSILMLTVLSVSYVCCASTWDSQIIDTNTVIGASVSAVADTSDNIQIAYVDYENGSSNAPIQVMYGIWNQSTWSTSVVSLGRGVVDIALDSRNKPCLVFNDFRNGSLLFAQMTEGRWNIQKIDSHGSAASLAVDSKDKPHVAYIANGDLKYAFWSGSNWSIQTVDSAQLLIYRVSLVVDSANNPHILYGYSTDSVNQATLKYAVLENSGWSIQEVVSGIPDYFGNLVLDSYDLPHFTYEKNYPSSTIINSTLLYRSWNGSTWNDQVVASRIDRLYGAGQLTLDSNNYPHIAFFNASLDLSTGSLVYARWTGSVWDFQVVDSSNATSAGPVLLDSKGNPHIFYLALPHEPKPDISYLRYATYNNGSMQAVEGLQAFYLLIPIVLIVALILVLYVIKKSRPRNK